VTKFNRVYAIYISNVDSSTSIKCFIIATIRIANFIIKSKLFIEFIKYADVFNIEKASVLTAYNKNKYTINLDGNKLSFKPLYNLSIKKLKILKTYFNDTLTKR
jgi:fructose-1,6-bisphosphatase